jgi:hypothetical protein
MMFFRVWTTDARPPTFGFSAAFLTQRAMQRTHCRAYEHESESTPLGVLTNDPRNTYECWEKVAKG